MHMHVYTCMHTCTRTRAHLQSRSNKSKPAWDEYTHLQSRNNKSKPAWDDLASPKNPHILPRTLCPAHHTSGARRARGVLVAVAAVKIPRRHHPRRHPRNRRPLVYFSLRQLRFFSSASRGSSAWSRGSSGRIRGLLGEEPGSSGYNDLCALHAGVRVRVRVS